MEKENKKILISKGKKNNLFFILPSIMVTKYKKNTWYSEKKIIIAGFLKYYFQIEITQNNKNINYDITQELIQNVNYILNNNNYWIDNSDELKSFLMKNKNIILLLKNSNIKHKYLEKTFINLIKYEDFIKYKKG